jgi:hypothetical protein
VITSCEFLRKAGIVKNRKRKIRPYTRANRQRPTAAPVEALRNASKRGSHPNEPPYAPICHVPVAIGRRQRIERYLGIAHHRPSMIEAIIGSLIGTVRGGLSFTNGSAGGFRESTSGRRAWRPEFFWGMRLWCRDFCKGNGSAKHLLPKTPKSQRQLGALSRASPDGFQ